MESKQFSDARDHLARAEKVFFTEDASFHIEEGLALLEEIILEDPPGLEATTAKNLGTTYTKKYLSMIGDALQKADTLTEPNLERLFDLSLTLENTEFAGSHAISKPKVEIVDKLFYLYFQGYSDEEKRVVLKRLAQKHA